MKIYICSPLRGDIEANIKKAQTYCREVILQGHLPICPHIYFTQFLDDNVESERNTGMVYGLKALEMCDEVWVYGEPSEGMKAEIELAEKLGVEVKYFGT